MSRVDSKGRTDKETGKEWETERGGEEKITTKVLRANEGKAEKKKR